jgi:hypothetical protein
MPAGVWLTVSSLIAVARTAFEAMTAQLDVTETGAVAREGQITVKGPPSAGQSGRQVFNQSRT